MRRDGRRHRHDGLPARRADRRARHPPGQPLRLARGRAAARDRDRRIRVRELLRAPPRAATRARRPRSRRSATSSRVYEPLLAEGRDIVSIHLSAGISGTCESAEQARQRLLDEGKGGERIHVYDSRSGCGGQGLRRAGGRQRRRRRAPSGADDAGGRRAMPRGAGDVVRDRHARVPAQGRADRRRPGVARLGASDQADPHARRGDHPGRAGAHAAARLRADGRVRAPAPRRRRRRLGRPAHPGPRDGSPPGRASAARSSAPSPRSSPRSAR